MEHHGYHLETLYSNLNSYYDTVLRDQYSSITWKKHIYRKEQAEFIGYFNINFLNTGGKKDSIENYNIKEALSLLRKKSQSWPIPIHQIHYENSKICLTLSRLAAFQSVLLSVLKAEGAYGNWPALNVSIAISRRERCLTDDLTNHRIHVFEEITRRLLICAGYSVQENEKCDIRLEFSRKPTQLPNSFVIFCAKVVFKDGFDYDLTLADYLKSKENDIRKMSAHKYWENSHEEDIKNLTDACVTVDLAQIKPKNSVRLHVGANADGRGEERSKGAVFILYNYARLRAIRNKFESMVSNGTIPALPAIEDIDLSLLTQNDEWKLLFEFLLEYPNMIKKSVEKVQHGEVNPHNLSLFVSGLCHAFSVYYSHIRILLENRPHLNSTMFARVSLISAVELVLRHSLNILQIDTIEHM